MAGDKITALNGGVKLTTIADNDVLAITDVSEAGTGTTKPIERGELLKKIVDLNVNDATELTVAGGVLTCVQSAHKIQPEGGVADAIDTINGLAAGSIAALYVTDEGVDTITFKHGTGNISCIGGTDVAVSEGSVLAYSDGTLVYLVGGGGGAALEKATGAEIITGTDDAKFATPKALADAGIRNGQNFLINGSFRVAQRGITFTGATAPLNSDDTYLLDRWVLLSDGNDIVDVSQSVVVPDGAKNSIKLEVETANKQFGILQILENKDAMSFAGKKASLSFQARMAAADDNTHSVKAVVLAWNNAVDVVTSDIVDAWSDTPSVVANWTKENVAASNTLTTSWQEFKIENISIDTASMANLAVFIYCDQTDGVVDDAIYITNVKLEIGETATDFVARPNGEELTLCQSYFLKANNVRSGRYCIAMILSTTLTRGIYFFPTTMIGNPVATFSLAAANYQVSSAAGAIDCTVLAANSTTKELATLAFTVAAGLTAGQACILRNKTGITAAILFDAEL